MTFPVYLRLGPLVVHPHWVFEFLAYGLAFYWYRSRRDQLEDVVGPRVRAWVIGAAAVGGLLGSRLLAMAEDPAEFGASWSDPGFVLGGKTIVGGLVGGLIAVEWIKRRLGVRVATGDRLALPLIVGIAIGRIGCFLSGLTDRSYGIATRLAWGVNFGDGIARHPTQIYEIAFLAALAGWLVAIGGRMSAAGDRFKLFMLAYMTFRLAVDFIKPASRVGGLSVIQWTCVAVIAFYAPHLPRLASEVRRG
jgi:phosphatidylglycerol:prolipoprotein diacylglycerol transferase